MPLHVQRHCCQCRPDGRTDGHRPARLDRVGPGVGRADAAAGQGDRPPGGPGDAVGGHGPRPVHVGQGGRPAGGRRGVRPRRRRGGRGPGGAAGLRPGDEDAGRPRGRADPHGRAGPGGVGRGAVPVGLRRLRPVAGQDAGPEAAGDRGRRLRRPPVRRPAGRVRAGHDDGPGAGHVRRAAGAAGGPDRPHRRRPAGRPRPTSWSGTSPPPARSGWPGPPRPPSGSTSPPAGSTSAPTRSAPTWAPATSA